MKAQHFLKQFCILKLKNLKQDFAEQFLQDLYFRYDALVAYSNLLKGIILQFWPSAPFKYFMG